MDWEKLLNKESLTFFEVSSLLLSADLRLLVIPNKYRPIIKVDKQFKDFLLIKIDSMKPPLKDEFAILWFGTIYLPTRRYTWYKNGKPFNPMKI